MSGNGDYGMPPVAGAELRAHEDARKIVRLFQCSQCSYPLREPMTLPCGNSMCRPCLPPLYKRENITYPLNAGRLEAFTCPFPSCGMEHSVGDCSIDVQLRKIVEIIRADVATYRVEVSETPLRLDEVLDIGNVAATTMEVMPRSRVLHGGCLVATYVFADMGELNYHSDVAYTPVNEETADTIRTVDVTVLEHFKESIQREIECQVCYSLMLDPLTTTCGHTFCRKCVARILDHSDLCPVCRRHLPMRPGVQAEPSNKRISYILSGLAGAQLAQRLASADLEELIDEDVNMPLFPCTIAYPMMPTFLHIFEPRYRLMVRRAVENGDRRFGMMMYNSRRQPQGSLGHVHYMQYGTLLYIERLEMFADGRSLLQTIGQSRFRILETDMRDGYLVGRIQRIEDMPLAEEEAIEIRETSGEAEPSDPALAAIHRMSTQGLLQYSLDFIAQARAASARWLHESVLRVHGPPPTDPAVFPYWAANVLPIEPEQGYLLLPVTSVRQRLKITARWIQGLQAARW